MRFDDLILPTLTSTRRESKRQIIMCFTVQTYFGPCGDLSHCDVICCGSEITLRVSQNRCRDAPVVESLGLLGANSQYFYLITSRNDL